MKFRDCISKIPAWGLGCILVLELFWLAGGYFVLNKFLSASVLTEILNKETGIEAVINDIKYIPKADFSLSIKTPEITVKQDKKNIIQISNLESNVKVLPLLFNKLYLSKLNIDNVYLNIIRQKDGTINLLKLLPENLPTPDIKQLRTNINTYNILFNDEKVSVYEGLKGKDLIINNFIPNKTISVKTSGTINTSAGASDFDIAINTNLPIEKKLTHKDFTLNIGLEKLNLSALTPFAQYIKFTNIKNFDGIVSATIKTATDKDTQEKELIGTINTQNLYIKEDLPENDTYLKEKTDINFKIALLPKDIEIKSFTLKNEHHDLNITGKVKNIEAKKPELDLKVKLHNDIKSMIYTLVPSEIEFENRMLAKIKKYKPKATVDGEITIKGDCIEPDIEGEFSAPDLFIDLPDTRAANAKIKLTFLKKKLHIFTHVITGKGRFVDVDGTLDMYGKKSGIFDVNTSKNVDLKLARAVLMPIQDTFSLHFSVLNYIYAQAGEGDTKLHIDGTREDATVDGRLNFYNGHANFDGINTFIDKINGYLNFKGKNADFATTSAYVNGDKINISGTGSALGPFSVDISSDSIKTQTLLDILMTSHLLTPVSKDLNELHKITKASGKSQFNINVKGDIDLINPVINFEKMEYNGVLNILNNIYQIKNIAIPIKFQNATVNFDKKQITAKANAKVSESPINADLTITNNKNLKINGLVIKTFGSTIKATGQINNFNSQTPDINVDTDIRNFDISHLNGYKNNKVLGSTLNKIISAYENYKGTINGNLKYRKTGLNGNLHANDIAFTHKKMQMPVSIKNVDLNLKNDTIYIQSINATVDNVPLYANATIKDFTKKPFVKGYFTSNLYPSFVNKYINANLSYPVKLKGEMRTKSYFEGYSDNLKSTTVFSLPISSDISYMGANLGEEDFAREMRIEMIQRPDSIFINRATLAKYIPSLSGESTRYPILNISGKITKQNTPVVQNFRIKTLAKTNSKFLNVLFKKSIIKNGDFECDLNINGKISNPKIIGFLKFNGLEMPLYETKINDLTADFKNKEINIKSEGTTYNTDVNLQADIENKFNPPFNIKNLSINADYLDLDKIFESISKVTMQTPHSIKISEASEFIEPVNLADFTVNKGLLTAKEINIKGFPATKLKTEFHQNADGVLRIENFDFQIADGTVNASGLYNTKTSHFKGDCIAKSIDANQFSQLFLNIKNQIYGTLDGTVNFSTTGSSPDTQIKNLEGKVSFKISNGKMPKLGSLEYLLRAGNIIKSGITGFTANSIIELLVPIKTGEFSAISGLIDIVNGNADNIQIYSKGKNLSLYITGKSDLLSQNAQMNVYGRLSKKVSTLLGPVGNTSLNTLFSIIPGIKMSDSDAQILKDINKIPGLEITSDEYRFFNATIDGDINGNNYVKTFKWIE